MFNTFTISNTCCNISEPDSTWQETKVVVHGFDAFKRRLVVDSQTCSSGIPLAELNQAAFHFLFSLIYWKRPLLACAWQHFCESVIILACHVVCPVTRRSYGNTGVNWFTSVMEHVQVGCCISLSCADMLKYTVFGHECHVFITAVWNRRIAVWNVNECYFKTDKSSECFEKKLHLSGSQDTYVYS